MAPVFRMSSGGHVYVRTFFLTMLFVIGVSPTSVQANECSLIEDGIERLACFDRQFPRPQSELVDATPVNGDWVVSVETSAMTDETNVYLRLESEQPVYCSWSSGNPVTLLLRCRENTTSAIFSTGCHMTSSRYNNYGDVTYRLDDEAPRVKGFTESTNNRSLGLWRGGQAIPFIREMLDNEQLLVRMMPYGESAFEVSFNISGLDEAIQPLRDACGW